MNFEKQDVDIEKIVLHKSDGTAEEIQTGFIGNLEEDQLTLRFTGMSGKDLVAAAEALVVGFAKLLPEDHFDGEEGQE